MKLGKVLFAFLIIAGIGVGSASAGDKVKIGYIDIQKVLNSSRAGMEAKQILTEESQERQKILEDQDKELKALKEELERKGSALSTEARAEKEGDLKSKQDEFRNLLAKMELELQRKDLELTQSILKDLEGIISELGKKGRYDLIVEKNEGVVLYAPPDYDLSEQVIKLYDAEKKDSKE